MKKRNESGIYQIRNRVNGKVYIGSAINLRHRWNKHLSDLRCERHSNAHLQAAFRKYGEGVFEFSVLESVEPRMLIEREQDYFDALHPEYNISPTAGSRLGYRHTKETRMKISRAQRGKQASEETRRKMSEALSGKRHPNYGKHHSEATRREISKALKGRSPEEMGRYRRTLSEALKGKRHSEEARRKMSEAKKGKPLSEWHRKRVSEGMMGHQVSEETREKISKANKNPSAEIRRKIGAAHRGKHPSAETRRKMSEARKRWWVKHKQAARAEYREET